MSNHDDDLDDLLKGVCDCESGLFCKWHQRLRDGESRLAIIHDLKILHREQEFLALLDSLCTCSSDIRCQWHQRCDDGEDREHLLAAMEDELDQQHHRYSMGADDEKTS
jgi:hypothetical protein